MGDMEMKVEMKKGVEMAVDTNMGIRMKKWMEVGMEMFGKTNKPVPGGSNAFPLFDCY